VPQLPLGLRPVLSTLVAHPPGPCWPCVRYRSNQGGTKAFDGVIGGGQGFSGRGVSNGESRPVPEDLGGPLLLVAIVTAYTPRMSLPPDQLSPALPKRPSADNRSTPLSQRA
jgi:hypothetical protein